MFTDFSNPSVWHVQLTKHAGGYEIQIKQGERTINTHPKLVRSFKRAWDLGEELLAHAKYQQH